MPNKTIGEITFNTEDLDDVEQSLLEVIEYAEEKIRRIRTELRENKEKRKSLETKLSSDGNYM